MFVEPEGTMPHYLIPLDVYEAHKEKIDTATDGEFNPNAMYNIVFLYTDAADAKRAGTVQYGKSPEYASMVSRILREIWEKEDPSDHRRNFQGLHAYLREGMFVNKRPGVLDPCASKNPAPPKKKRWWRRGQV